MVNIWANMIHIPLRNNRCTVINHSNPFKKYVWWTQGTYSSYMIFVQQTLGKFSIVVNRWFIIIKPSFFIWNMKNFITTHMFEVFLGNMQEAMIYIAWYFTYSAAYHFCAYIYIRAFATNVILKHFHGISYIRYADVLCNIICKSHNYFDFLVDW